MLICVYYLYTGKYVYTITRIYNSQYTKHYTNNQCMKFILLRVTNNILTLRYVTLTTTTTKKTKQQHV